MNRIAPLLLCLLALPASASTTGTSGAKAWRLAGTLLQDEGAAIVVADGVHKRINTGDTLAGCQLLSVTRRHARFSCDERDLQIALGVALDTAQGAQEISPPQAGLNSNGSVTLQRDAVMSVVQDRQRLVAELSLEPVVSDSIINGYRLLEAPLDGLAIQAGFERGDIVRSVNGEAVNSGAFAGMLNNLEEQQQISIGFERNGQPMQTVLLLR